MFVLGSETFDLKKKPQAFDPGLLGALTSGTLIIIIVVILAVPHLRHTEPSLYQALNLQRYTVGLRLTNKLAVDFEDSHLDEIFNL